MFSGYDHVDSSPDINYNGSSDTLSIPLGQLHLTILCSEAPWIFSYSSPVMNLPPSGASQSTSHQMFQSLMESQKKVLSFMENVSVHLDELEQSVQGLISSNGDECSSKADVGGKIRVPSQLSVCLIAFCVPLLLSSL